MCRRCIADFELAGLLVVDPDSGQTLSHKS
jgi:hypothetical protein